MDVKALLTDDDAVSPVIGVILMVAITVILAAVIGTFVLQLGEQTGNAQPTTTFDFDYTEGATGFQCDLDSAAGDTLNVTHNGGDDITASRLDLRDDDGESAGWEDCDADRGPDSKITTGDTASAQVEGDSKVKVVWTASGGGDSAPLGNWEGPDA